MEILNLLFIIVGITIVNGGLPDGFNFPKCKRNDTHLEKCLIAAIDAIRPQLINGIPEIELPSLEPFKLNTLPVEASQLGLRTKSVVKNIVVKGGGDFQIKDFKIDYKTQLGTWTVVLPKIDLTADYNADGTKLVFIDIDSDGKFTGNFNNVVIGIKARARYDPDDDKLRLAYVTVTDLSLGWGSTINIHPEKQGFFRKFATSLVNMAPAKLTVVAIEPSIKSATGPIIKKYINKILDEMPLSDILTD